MPSPNEMSDDDLLARILQDAETTTIADALGLEPADYAARVMHYIRNPNAEPQIYKCPMQRRPCKLQAAPACPQ